MCVCVCVCVYYAFRFIFKFLYAESDKSLNGSKHVAGIITQFCQTVLDFLLSQRNVLHQVNNSSTYSNKFPTTYRALRFIAAPTTACHLSPF